MRDYLGWSPRPRARRRARPDQEPEEPGRRRRRSRPTRPSTRGCWAPITGRWCPTPRPRPAVRDHRRPRPRGSRPRWPSGSPSASATTARWRPSTPRRRSGSSSTDCPSCGRPATSASATCGGRTPTYPYMPRLRDRAVLDPRASPTSRCCGSRRASRSRCPTTASVTRG